MVVHAQFISVELQTFFGALQRSKEEWLSLLSGDGLFEVVGITTTEVQVSIIECIKV